MLELLTKFTSTFGVSGNEDEISKAILTEIQNHVDEAYSDTMGNLIAVKKGTGRKVMLAAHMDEAGIMATYTDEKGFIRFSAVGCVSPYFALAQRVRFRNGVTGTVFYEEKLDDMKNLKFNKMYVDIGAKNRDEAQSFVKIGDTAVFCGELVKTGTKVISKAMDDRSGCVLLADLIKNPPVTDNEIYYVFTAQEEIGLRGAKTAAYNIKPDIAIGVDVTGTGDTPGCQATEVNLGKGPAVKIMDRSYITHQGVKRLIEDTADKLGIELQREILEKGKSDPGAIHLEAGGIPSGGISIPCRYIHSPVETIDLEDLEKAEKLLRGCVEGFKGF